MAEVHQHYFSATPSGTISPSLNPVEDLVTNAQLAALSTQTTGDSYIVTDSPNMGKIATWTGTSWVYYTPVDGAKVTVLTGLNAGTVYTYASSTMTWTPKASTTNFDYGRYTNLTQLNASVTAPTVGSSVVLTDPTGLLYWDGTATPTGATNGYECTYKIWSGTTPTWRVVNFNTGGTPANCTSPNIAINTITWDSHESIGVVTATSIAADGVTNTTWVSDYSIQTFNAPFHMEYIVNPFISGEPTMFGLLASGSPQPAGFPGGGTFAWYTFTSATRFVGGTVVAGSGVSITNGDKFVIEVLSDRTILMWKNNQVYNVGTMPVGPFKLFHASSQNSPQVYSSVKINSCPYNLR